MKESEEIKSALFGTFILLSINTIFNFVNFIAQYGFEKFAFVVLICFLLLLFFSALGRK